MSATAPTHPETQANPNERRVRKTQTLPKERRSRVYPRINHELHQRLAAFCARKGITQRDGLEQAVRQYLDGSIESEANIFGQLRKIALALEADRNERQKAHQETHRAVEVLSEAFGRFVRLTKVTDRERACDSEAAPRAAAAKPPAARPEQPASVPSAGSMPRHDRPPSQEPDWVVLMRSYGYEPRR